jgi:hypothetical protein
VDQASGVSLVLGTFAVEKKTLAGLTGPRSIVCNTSLLRADVASQGIGGQRLLAEPEEVLGEVELPAERISDRSDEL